MLLFQDKPKQIRVMRVSPREGAATRDVLGFIPKATLSLSDELRNRLDGEEIAEVETLVETCRKGETMTLQLNALKFPTMAREAMDYFEDGAGEVEQRMIASALVDAIRRLKKYERTSGVAF